MSVLDASALLAYLLGEPGSERVRDAMAVQAIASAVNLAEVLSKLADGGHDPERVMDRLAVLPLEVLAFDDGQALESALLRASTAGAGLSLADRACLALARRLGRTVLTADRTWRGLVPGIEVELIR